MIVSTLKLRNFRNYENSTVILNPGINWITGDNAQGKTNLLESLVYLSLTRSHRISNDTQLIRKGCEFARIGCSLKDENGNRKTLEAVIHAKGKSLLVNHAPVNKSSQFVGILNTVLFSPDDLSIFSDAPRERRKIMNQEIAKLDTKYLLAINHYQNLLKERNAHLKNPHPDEAYLDVLDEQMINDEVLIIEKRRRFTSRINAYLNDFYRMIADDTAKAVILYEGCIHEEETDIRAALKQRCADSRPRDLENRFTTVGIHRDDLVFELNGQNVTETASQGQKRMVMLAFRLCDLEYIREETGKRAVLLLDDVLSELDQHRQEKLMRTIDGRCQCIITATGIPALIRSKNPYEIRIRNGNAEGMERK